MAEKGNAQKEAKQIPSGIESVDVPLNGLTAHYLKAGSGAPLLLLHGGASDSRDWLETMSQLSAKYSMYAPDIVGYGLSSGGKDVYTLNDFVEFTTAFITQAGLEPCHLVGHSLGGRVCLEIALRYPQKVRKLVLVDSMGFGRFSKFGTFLGTAAYKIRQLLGRPQPYPVFSLEENGVKDWMCLNELPRLKVPTFLVWQQADPYLSSSGARQAAELIPDARLTVIPGYGHAPHKKNPAGFSTMLSEFLG